MSFLRNFRICTALILVLSILFLVGCGGSSSSQNTVDAVGFDLDDTLIFSSPAFNKGFEEAHRAFSDEFWRIVNSSDRGRSCVKTKTQQILQQHRKKERDIFVITARNPVNSHSLKDYVSDKFDIPRNHVYMEPDGKTRRIEDLGIDIYYGDSDSDITDAQNAGIKAIRIQRHPDSGYQKKYHPGKYDEKVIQNSAQHHCPT